METKKENKKVELAKGIAGTLGFIILSEALLVFMWP